MPYEINKDLKKVRGVNWKDLILKTAWDYGRKLNLLNKLLKKSKLKKGNVMELDYEIKKNLIKRYLK